jgi:hypothetical protein
MNSASCRLAEAGPAENAKAETRIAAATRTAHGARDIGRNVSLWRKSHLMGKSRSFFHSIWRHIHSHHNPWREARLPCLRKVRRTKRRIIVKAGT